MQHLSIGAVAKLTGIPAHTLRKWESRHGIAIPVRTDTGRRVYTDEHVQHLRLIKLLVERRHGLAQLAPLSLDELKRLAAMHEEDDAHSPERIALIGANVSRLLLADQRVAYRNSDPTADEAWRNDLEAADADCAVAECDAVFAPEVESLVALAESVEKVLLIYRFASRRQLSELQSAGIHCLQSPVSDADLLSALGAQTPPVKTDDNHPPARFDIEELARIAALTPGIECECPNHIAKLLMDISSFERYSEACVDEDPKERALHQQLSRISAQARRLFEDALIAVTAADGLQINQKV